MDTNRKGGRNAEEKNQGPKQETKLLDIFPFLPGHFQHLQSHSRSHSQPLATASTAGKGDGAHVRSDITGLIIYTSAQVK